MPKTNEKDAYFFSHDCNARNDPKILALRSVYGAEGYGVYFMLVEILREQPEYRLSVNKYIWNTLAMQMQVEASRLEQIITDCCTEFAENGSTLLVNDGEYLYSASLLRRMGKVDDISNLRREAAQKRWKNQPCKADDGSGASTSNANAEQTDANKRKAKQSMLLLSAIDNNLVQATKLLGSQAGRTLDTITREVLNGGTNVQYAEGQVDSRANLCGGSTTDSQNHYLTVDAVRRAVRYLKVMNAPKINGYYAGIIHPDCSYDLMSDPKWVNVKTYSDPDGIYEGEIGRIEGVRFVETSEAKVFTHAGKDYETGTTASGTVTPKASARDVYSTLILGADAYGVTEITGGGLQHIVKQLGSAGTADPLDQRATAGWKATKVAERLVEAYMVRIETCSTFNS